MGKYDLAGQDKESTGVISIHFRKNSRENE